MLVLPSNSMDPHEVKEVTKGEGYTFLGACRAWGIESEKAAARGKILTILPAHSGTMVQEIGEIWTA